MADYRSVPRMDSSTVLHFQHFILTTATATARPRPRPRLRPTATASATAHGPRPRPWPRPLPRPTAHGLATATATARPRPRLGHGRVYVYIHIYICRHLGSRYIAFCGAIGTLVGEMLGRYRRQMEWRISADRSIGRSIDRYTHPRPWKSNE